MKGNDMALTDAEKENYERVFGFDVKFDENGKPIEQGIGSPSQPNANPTSKPSTAVKPEQLEFLRKMVAACNSPTLAKDFEQFLRWRERDAIHRASVVEIAVEQIINPGLSKPQQTEPRKIDLYRQKLRAGLLAPPIKVSVIAGSNNLFQLADGTHRLQAARLEHRQYIRAEIVAGPTADRS
jgi:hypothetical protein